MSELELVKIDDWRWELPRTGSMRVPGRVFANETLLEAIRQDESLRQVANVASLPGILKYSFAMPDIHLGYGFAIGGVAAFDLDEGVISPGGVGYDINCGVRLVRTNLKADDIKDRLKEIANQIFRDVPSGVGSSGAIQKVSREDQRAILVKGAAWAAGRGMATESDLDCTEERGQLAGADPSCVSDQALKRGSDQTGTLGSGNHFLEVSRVTDVYDKEAGNAFGLWEGQAVMQIHCGSRGLGHQICTDYVKVMLAASRKYGIELADRELAAGPVKSDEGKRYFAAMACAANYAWNNRQVIMHLATKALGKALSMPAGELGAALVWDVAHNIAKFEEHEVDGERRKVLIHRKGATRAFGPSRPEIPARYKAVGQPVLIPGDMGRQSFVCVGTDAAEETFSSTCHGAGRNLSRHAAKARARGRNIIKELAGKGIFIRAEGMGTVVEEMPEAYKDVGEVVKVMHNAGISRKVARLVPMAVVKG